MRILQLITRASPACRLLPVAAALALAAVPSTQAQNTGVDPRWLPWLGCWQRVEDTKPLTGDLRLACVLPAEGASAVEIVTVVNGTVITRERVDASSQQRAVDHDGCTGTERVTWAADGRRVFRNAELDCQGGLHQAASQMLAIAPDGDWLDVQGVTVHEQTGLRVLRYREAVTGLSVPEEIAVRLRDVGSAASLARTALASPVAVADVVEAAGQVPAPVVQAWLMEQGQDFQLGGQRLLELSAQGVPGGVIDVMVALSHPNVFQLNRATQTAELLPPSQTRTPASPYAASSAPYASGSCDPYIDSFSLFGSARCGYYSGGLYGIGSYWGFGAPHRGGWYWGRQPIIVVSGGAGGGGGGASHGKVVNGSGYRPGPGDPSPSRQGRPRDGYLDGPSGRSGNGSGAANDSGSGAAGGSGSGAGSSGGASGGSGSGAGSSGGGSSAPASGGERTAKPRP